MRISNLTPRRLNIFRGFKSNSHTANLTQKQLEAVRKFHLTWHKLASNFLVSGTLRVPTALGFTSATHGEGKTINSLALSTALARAANTKVLLLECDFGSESVALELGLDPKPGLLEYLAEKCPFEDTLRRFDPLGLDIVLMGGDGAIDAEWEPWHGPTFHGLNRELPGILEAQKGRYSCIVLDMPPILTNPYTTEMIDLLDGAFLAVRAEFSAIENVADAIQEVRDERLLGVMVVGEYSQLPSWLIQLLAE